jgi:hypothetical protein
MAELRGMAIGHRKLNEILHNLPLHIISLPVLI